MLCYESANMQFAIILKTTYNSQITFYNFNEAIINCCYLLVLYFKLINCQNHPNCQNINNNQRYHFMIRRNLNSGLLSNTKQIQNQSYSVHKVEPKIQQIRHNRRYSISGNSLSNNINSSILKSSLSNQYKGVTQNYISHRRDSYQSNRKQNDQQNRKSSNYNYTTKPILQARQFNEWQCNNSNLSCISSVKRQTNSGVSQLRNRNRTYLPNENQKQTLLLNVNYSKYSDGLSLRKQYNYQAKPQYNYQTKPLNTQNNISSSITVNHFQNQLNSHQVLSKNHINYQQVDKANRLTAVKSNCNVSLKEQATPNNTHSSKVGQSSTKLKYDYQKLDKKYNYSRISNQQKQKEPLLDSNQYFNQIQLVSYKNIKPLFQQNTQKLQDYNHMQIQHKNEYPLQQKNRNKNRNNKNIQEKYLKPNICEQKQFEQKMKRNQRQTLEMYEQMKIQSEKQFKVSQNQDNYDSSSLRKNNELQTQSKAIDSLKQRLQQAILQKPNKNTFDVRNQNAFEIKNKKNITIQLDSQTNNIIDRLTPRQSSINEKTIQKVKINKIINQKLNSSDLLEPLNSSTILKESTILNASFSNLNQCNQQNQNISNKQNKLENKYKMQEECNKYGSIHENSRLSMQNQEKCLKLLDFNIPTIGIQNRKRPELKQKQTKELIQINQWNNIQNQPLKNKAEYQTNYNKSSQTSNNKMCTLSKLKMIGEFNDKINQRIKHIIQNFQGYQMKI